MTDPSAPRLLFISPVVPDRHWSGLAMRMAQFAMALSAAGRLDIVVVPSFDVEAALRKAESAGVACLDTRGKGDTHFTLIQRIADPNERLRQFRLYGRGSRHATISSSVLADLRSLIGATRYDHIHIGRLYLADAIDAVPAGTSATLDLDEDDAAAWRMPTGSVAPVEAAWREAEAVAEDRLLGRRAGQFARRFISGPLDRDSLRQRHPGLELEVIENAVSFDQQPASEKKASQLLFVGSMGYAPNVAGISWFLSEVWPHVLARRGDAGLTIVGRAMPEHLRRRAGTDNISIVADPPDVAPFYADAALAIAPLFSGRGTRLKLVEAAAFGTPIVATSPALAGLEFASDDALWRADSAEAFTAAILHALSDPAERQRRAATAFRRARQRHELTNIVSALARDFGSMLKDSSHERGHDGRNSER